MKIKHNLVIVGLALGLSGCGGGSDGESSQQANANPPPATAATIVVPAGFDFATSKSLEIQVDLTANSPDPRLYLTVCRNLPGQIEPDFERCLSRAPVVNGVYEGSIQLPNDVNALTATVWSYSPAGVVATVNWNRQTSPAGPLQVGS